VVSITVTAICANHAAASQVSSALVAQVIERVSSLQRRSVRGRTKSIAAAVAEACPSTPHPLHHRARECGRACVGDGAIGGRRRGGAFDDR
jgi:hypothetical protein